MKYNYTNRIFFPYPAAMSALLLWGCTSSINPYDLNKPEGVVNWSILSGLELELPLSSGSVNSNKKIFITASSFTGNLGGVSGADSLCNSDANKPDASIYSALLFATTRTFSAGWPLLPNTPYYRDDGTTLISTTDSSGRLMAAGSNSPSDTRIDKAWTGMRLDPWCSTLSNCTWTCGDWTNGSSGWGDTGRDFLSDAYYSFANTNSGCSTPRYLYCVQQ